MNSDKSISVVPQLKNLSTTHDSRLTIFDFRFSLSLFLTLSLSLLLSGCGDDPVIPNEEELITHVILVLTPEGGGDTIVYAWIDEDGEGGNPPLVGGDTLSTTTIYHGRLLLRNESGDVPLDISMEVEEEAEDHLVFYQLSAPALGQIQYEDEDANGKPLGLRMRWQTFQPFSGTLQILLRHEPDKNADPLTPANAGGATDVDVAFQVLIQ